MPNLNQLSHQGPTLPPGLYVHVPFCKSKCPYCDFYSIASSSLIPRWFEYLKKEIVLYRGRFTSFDSLYLGGGTPSLLDVSMVEEIFGLIKDTYNIIGNAEITIEVNPGDLTMEKINGFNSLGINRINLGIQSLNEKDLLFLGRRHSVDDAEKALNDLRRAGFDNIGVDLIYGLKNQTLKEWMHTLERTVSFYPEHISCYQLTLEGKTAFNAMKARGEVEELPEERASSFFLETSDFLTQQGYIHYEVSNYARNTSVKSRHNFKYWKRIPYLGLGPSAHSFDGKKRWWNHRSIRKYCEYLEGEKAPVEDIETLTEEQKILEKVSLGLRTSEGITIDEIAVIPGITARISEMVASGHLKITDNIIFPTKKGLLVADQLPLFLIGDN